MTRAPRWRRSRSQPVIGLDTETYWDYGERLNRLSLLQLAAPTGEVIVIDALTAGIIEARALIENPSRDDGRAQRAFRRRGSARGRV